MVKIFNYNIQLQLLQIIPNLLITIYYLPLDIIRECSHYPVHSLSLFVFCSFAIYINNNNNAIQCLFFLLFLLLLLILLLIGSDFI